MDTGKPEVGTPELVVDTPAMHPATAQLLKFFKFEHLPPALQAVSQPFCELANRVATELPDGAEKTVALRKLLESKDAAVRTMVK